MNATTALIKKLVADVCIQHHSKLINKNYAKLKQQHDHKLFGLCYCASEAFFHLVKNCNSGLKGAYARFNWRGNDVSHWIVIMPKGEVVDITAEQFKGELKLDYSTFKGCGFQQLSTGAKFIIAEVEKRLILL